MSQKIQAIRGVSDFGAQSFEIEQECPATSHE
jgi:hypothetical protein